MGWYFIQYKEQNANNNQLFTVVLPRAICATTGSDDVPFAPGAG
jgi:hypothetical protein